MSPFKCSLCGNTSFIPQLTITKPDRFELAIAVSSSNYTRQWVNCSSCGLSHNILPDESLCKLNDIRTSYYFVDFTPESLLSKYNKVMSLSPKHSDNFNRVKRILSFTSNYFNQDVDGLEFLDIGSGTGVFPSLLSSTAPASVKVNALEPDKIAFNHLRGLGKFPVFNLSLPTDELTSRFNFVSLNKVLEHFEHPLDFLQSAKSLLLDNSLIYVEVPHVASLSNCEPHDNILGPLHCHLYDSISLSLLFKKCLLEPLLINSILEPSGKYTVYGFATNSTVNLPTEIL